MFNMGLEDIKDQALEKFNELKEQLDENPHINTIKENYQTLPAQTQKIIAIAGVVIAALVLMYIPYSYISSSSDNVTTFNNNRSLIRQMFKYGQVPTGRNSLPTTSNSNSIVSQIRSSVSRFDLLPTQVVTIEELPLKDTGKALAKKPILQAAIKAKFRQLNLKQVVDIGYHFKQFRNHIKLIGTEIKEDGEKKQYFNVEYKLVSYAYPMKKEKIDKGSKKKKRNKKRSKRR